MVRVGDLVRAPRFGSCEGVNWTSFNIELLYLFWVLVGLIYFLEIPLAINSQGWLGFEKHNSPAKVFALEKNTKDLRRVLKA